jgi:hypothetical protein
MNPSASQVYRRLVLAFSLCLLFTCDQARAAHNDINPHGEPVPSDPLLACMQRMECDESIGPVWSPKTRFNWQKDTLAFPNDTFYKDGRDETCAIQQRPDGYPPIYMHRCFVLARAVIQFHKFARFDPSLPKISEEEYVALVRHVSRIPTWWPAFSPDHAIVIPGYKNLRDFSSARQCLVQRNIGWWLITYFRVGNWRMIFPSIEAMRPVAAEKIMARLDRGELQAVYLSVFPRMNHCVVIYDYSRLQNGDIVFWNYDPNYHNTSSWLVYDAKDRDFILQKRWFFPGGHVNLMRVYISPIH